MLTFTYQIKDEVGLHARPAGLLAKEAKKYQSRIIIKKEDKAVEATKLMAVMGFGVKYGQTVEVEVSGEDEEVAYNAMKEFFNQNL